MNNGARCWFPDGQSNAALYNPPFVPCDPTAAVSACCAIGETCVGEGMCYSNMLGNIYRGACTDQSWESPECPKVCADKMSGVHQALLACSIGAKNTYCCYAGSGNCCDNQFVFKPGVVSFVNITGKVTGNISSSTPAVSPVTSSLPSTTVTAHAVTSTGVGYKAGANPVAIGVGVGVPLLALLFVAILLFLLERRRRIEIEDRQVMPPPPPIMSDISKLAISTPVVEIGNGKQLPELGSGRAHPEHAKPTSWGVGEELEGHPSPASNFPIKPENVF